MADIEFSETTGLVPSLRCSRPFAERDSAGVTCHDRASDAGTRSRTGDVGERCVSRVYSIELLERLRVEWRSRREPPWHEAGRLWRRHVCGARLPRCVRTWSTSA